MTFFITWNSQIKSEKQINPDSFSILGQLRTELKKAVPTKNRKPKAVSESSIQDDDNVDIFFDDEQEEGEQIDVNEELEEVIAQDEISVIEEFFDIAAFERDQESLTDFLPQIGAERNDQPVEEEWSVNDILYM